MSSVEDSSSPPSSEAWKGPSKAANTGRSSKLRLASLVFLIYYSVSGGAFGIEQVVQAAHPRYAILGFSLILVWAVPEALVTAELSAALPEPSGSVAWVYVAFGRFWGYVFFTCIFALCVEEGCVSSTDTL
jgi:amino acid transporter